MGSSGREAIFRDRSRPWGKGTGVLLHGAALFPLTYFRSGNADRMLAGQRGPYQRVGI